MPHNMSLLCWCRQETMDRSTSRSLSMWSLMSQRFLPWALVIEERRETRLPMFAEWFEAWKGRSGGNGEDGVHVPE